MSVKIVTDAKSEVEPLPVIPANSSVSDIEYTLTACAYFWRVLRK
jgi:hypothetical protein